MNLLRAGDLHARQRATSCMRRAIAQVLAHMRIRDGNIELDCHGWQDRTRDLTITLPGREFPNMRPERRRQPDAQQSQSAVRNIAIGGAGQGPWPTAKSMIIKLAIGGSGNDRSGPDHRARGQGEYRRRRAPSARKAPSMMSKSSIGGSGRADFGEVGFRTGQGAYRRSVAMPTSRPATIAKISDRRLGRRHPAQRSQADGHRDRRVGPHSQVAS